MKKKLWIPLIIFLLSIIGWLSFKPPEVVTVREYVFVPEIVEVVKEIEVIKEVEVIVEVPRELREFRDLADLEAWRDDRFCYIFDKPYLKGIKDYSPKRDCDDVAETWVRQAIDDGFLISYCPIYKGKLGRKRVSRTKGWHMGCITFIGNNLYYIDTYPPYKITKVGIRDKE